MMRLSEFCRLYWDHHPNLSRGAFQQLEISVRLLSRFSGREVLLQDLSRDLLAAWMRWLHDGGRSPATVNSKRRSVLSLWLYAAELGMMAPPPRRIPLLTVPARLPVVWALADVQRLLETCRTLGGAWSGVPVGTAWSIAVLVIWDTGCRVGELLGARLVDVNLDSGLWFVPAEHTKGRRSDRLRRLHPDTLAVIRSSTPPTRDRLFPFPWGRRQLWPHFSRLLERAGLPTDRKHKFHCLRRTAESYAAASRGVAFAAEAVGHTEAVARKHYINPGIAPGPCLVDAVPRPKL